MVKANPTAAGRVSNPAISNAAHMTSQNTAPAMLAIVWGN
jgi:hypothetical protein